MRWSDNGDSFIITDIERLIKILPNYFKTRNYASFVRQLNMYDFYKVKGGKNHQEFRHPYFRRGYYKDLAYIRRKSVHKSQNNESEHNYEEESEVNENMQEKLETVKKSLEAVTAQNKSLIEANKNMIAKLCNFKGEYEVKIKKLFFIFMVLVHNYDDELLKLLKKPLEELNVNIKELKAHTDIADVYRYIEMLCKRMVSQEIDNQKLLDKFIEIFFDYFESKGSSIKKENFNWQGNGINAHNENFSISLLNTDTPAGISEPQHKFSRVSHSIKKEAPKQETGKPFLFRDSANQNLFRSPSKFNDINFDDLNINEDTGNMLIEKREEDSFLMSGANSVLMLSPFKRNT